LAVLAFAALAAAFALSVVADFLAEATAKEGGIMGVSDLKLVMM